MGQLRHKMYVELKLRGYSLGTRRNYLRSGIKLAQYFDRSPSDLGLPQIQQFLLHLIDDKQVGLCLGAPDQRSVSAAGGRYQ